MSDKELAVYRLIRAHYLAQFLPHHEFDRTHVQLTAAGQSLQAVGKQVIESGWHRVMPGQARETEQDETQSQPLPALKKTQCVPWIISS